MKPTPTFADIARVYHAAIHAARHASVDAEPEAQLTTLDDHGFTFVSKAGGAR